ncbi:hypothetical protein P152DRAFT_391947 [Eremomyces bilateralis CBS 781.70]|uniref:Uncharacterized protein n=1 Tax=Eremomyces bilateralis CBS 781.70 TaxID=1392243 RepID=A0A6G1GAS9_9PEZI|nr:uncharacterized protein P152DRAFT_391947 [Eremomyces bilateralis CBS 781.70]KAF1815046.1 hypothetical protein P152DRAFT_391947 [Eremomyces bilateralis CBS 781.70]
MREFELTGARYQPCTVLRDHHIPYVIWFEDALRRYGVPTGIFHHYLLVNDLDEAAEVLIQRLGWTLSSAPARIGSATVDTPQRRLLPPTNEDETVLLHAKDWHFDFSTGRVMAQGLSLPRLPALLDSLIGALLDDPLEDPLYWLHITCHVEYLYRYNADVKIKSFAQQLKKEHQQYHFDMLSGMDRGNLRWYRHERKIRDALRDGLWTLCDCSLDTDADPTTQPEGA